MGVEGIYDFSLELTNNYRWWELDSFLSQAVQGMSKISRILRRTDNSEVLPSHRHMMARRIGDTVKKKKIIV